MEQDLCIKAKNDFFSTTYYNICDGTEKLVNSGTMDMMGDVLGMAVAAALAIVVITGITAGACHLWRNA